MESNGYIQAWMPFMSGATPARRERRQGQGGHGFRGRHGWVRQRTEGFLLLPVADGDDTGDR